MMGIMDGNFLADRARLC